MAYLLGYDIGSSAIKAALLNSETGRLEVSAISPDTELEVSAPKPGWAEQDPETWWEHVVNVTNRIRTSSGVDLSEVRAIGIAYQMHGLVVVDEDQIPVRPSIIWCDSRAVEIGDRTTDLIGREVCLNRFNNFIGNFTASKLAWIRENETHVFKKIHKAMLPGDYIAMRLTGEINTTPSGLSEGILWDVQEEDLSKQVLSQLYIPEKMIAEIVPTFAVQGLLTYDAADQLGLMPGTPVSYRAGDQPNNALSLNVLNPGEIATTAGTSGVIYAVSGAPIFDSDSRVNTFVHVNHTKENPRYGVLMCVNGTGIQNRWIRQILSGKTERILYTQMNELASESPVGSDGLTVLPYGNGAERTLKNRDIAASIHGLNFNIHGREHLLRSIQEGIVFALNYGLDIMREMGLEIHTARAGYANMFLSPIMQEAFVNVTGCKLELYDTDGAQGAARGAGIGAGIYSNFNDAYTGLNSIASIEPEKNFESAYKEAYSRWLEVLKNIM